MKNKMKDITESFNEIWESAEAINEQGTRSKPRFCKIYQTRKKFITLGLYDTKTKRWSIFESINLSGNFRYNTHKMPPELDEMRAMVRAA